MKTNHQMNYYDYGKNLDIQGVMPVIGGGVNHDTHEYVDLGLPSGTLWATEDIKNESGETLFFSWGETIGNTDQQYFTQENYKYGPITYYGKEDEPHESDWGITKYNQDDGKRTLETMDDAAIANCGPYWCMPTSAQVQELISYTSQQQLEDGFVFSASNGNDIFFAFNGEYQAEWWTKDLAYMEGGRDYSCFNVYTLECAVTGSTLVNETTYRARGYRIRPVRKK